jgi:hypothetical protein
MDLTRSRTGIKRLRQNPHISWFIFDYDSYHCSLLEQSSFDQLIKRIASFDKGEI